MSRQDIFSQVNDEREHQDNSWGGAVFDDNHTLNDWVAFIVMYAGKAVYFKNSKEEQRSYLLKVLALATAALEAFDRNNGFAPRHYENKEFNMEENIITELNKLQMAGKSVEEIRQYIADNCTDEEREYIRYVYQQGGRYMGDSVIVAASLL